jgi:hypothetical protein
MKLRIRGNSVRLRLTQSEVAKIRKSITVESSVQFGPSSKNKLIYRIQTSRNGNQVTSTFEDQLLCVTVPHILAQSWSSTDMISIEAEQKVSENISLKILIEKDFFCLKPRKHEQEDESDLFLNPNFVSGTCG